MASRFLGNARPLLGSTKVVATATAVSVAGAATVAAEPAAAAANTPLFDVELFTSLLTTRYIGREFEYREEVESTMPLAKEKGASGGGDGFAILAECQTAGVGRRERGWVSQPQGNIYTSVVVRFDPSQPEWYKRALQLNFAISIAVVRACASVGVTDAKIKWPNDVWVGDRKISGSIVDNDASGFSVVGVGVNVNQDIEKSEELADIATSLYRECGEAVNRELVLATLYNNLESLMDESWESVMESYMELSMLIGRRIRVHHKTRETDDDRDFDAIAVSHGELGELIVRREDSGAEVALSGEEVSISPLVESAL